jgi:putative cardiolipin synthase
MRPAVIASTEVLFDDPRKGDIDAQEPSHIRVVLARSPPVSEVVFVNPYFIPQEKFVGTLVSKRAAGVCVRVLTNSLASADVLPVHAAYSKRRRELLSAGVALSELRPDAAARAGLIASDYPDAALALHSKVMVLDRERVFVGSMNLDPRSHRLNTEDGIMVHSPLLSRQVAEKLDVEFQPANCWQLSLKDGQIVWSTSRGGKTETTTDEPDASWWKQVKCQFFKLLPIEDEL